MDTSDLRVAPDPGLYGCDREVFAQIWKRVAPGENCPVELSGETPPALPAPEAPSCPITRDAPPEQEILPVCFGGGEEEAKNLQGLIRECLTGMWAYRAAARQGRRTAELMSMSQRKGRQAKRLSAACFLMTGVRYWPEKDVPRGRPMDFFALLRERFLAEQRLYVRLGQLGRDCRDDCLRELYLALGEESMELVHTIRLLVERET